ENASPFAVYTESCSLPFSTSYFAEMGVPLALLAAIPRSSETLASFMFAARSDFSSALADNPKVATNVAMRKLRMGILLPPPSRPAESKVKRRLSQAYQRDLHPPQWP